MPAGRELQGSLAALERALSPPGMASGMDAQILICVQAASAHRDHLAFVGRLPFSDVHVFVATSKAGHSTEEHHFLGVLRACCLGFFILFLH